MAISGELQARIAAMARQLCVAAGEVDPSHGDCWLDAVENQAIEIADALADPDTAPRRTVAEALRYLTNQQSRMNYAEYRRQGLPITSSHIESTVKQINRRVKGSEKFWDHRAEPLLQLAADHLSDDQPLRPVWRQRRQRLLPMRCYHAAA